MHCTAYQDQLSPPPPEADMIRSHEHGFAHGALHSTCRASCIVRSDSCGSLRQGESRSDQLSERRMVITHRETAWRRVSLGAASLRLPRLENCLRGDAQLRSSFSFLSWESSRNEIHSHVERRSGHERGRVDPFMDNQSSTRHPGHVSKMLCLARKQCT